MISAIAPSDWFARVSISCAAAILISSNLHADANADACEPGGKMISPPLHHPPKGCCFAIVILEPPSLSDGSFQEHGVRTMPDPLAGLPPRFLRTPEAARFLSISGRTLEKHRTYGTGPKYRKIGGRVVYAVEDLKAWADLGAKTSTSDPGIGTVPPAKRRTQVISAAPETRRR